MRGSGVTGGSFWIDSTPEPAYPALEGDEEARVAVVGGGITGLTTALLLQREGVSVALLEADTIGEGATGRTTGKVTAKQGLAYSKIESEHGEKTAGLYAASQAAAVELVFRLAEELGIECDLERIDDYVFAEREDELEQLEKEERASRNAGLAVELVRDPDTPFPALAALRLGGQAQLHARKYVLGLARALEEAGGRIFQGTRVQDFESSRNGTRCVRAGDGSVAAEHVVLATHAPITFQGLFFARTTPHAAYAVAAPVDASPFEGSWINVGSPTRSLRTNALDDGRRLLVVVGEGHKVGQEDDTPARYDALREYARRHFPAVEIGYRWSTQDHYPVDVLPFIGRVGGEDGVYVATGFSGWGLSNGTLAGMLIRDAIAGRANEWAQVYDPERSSLASAPIGFVRENANVAKALIGGKLRRRPDSLDAVEPGSGAVVRVEGGKAAVYRDAEGRVTAVSARCTHMGCDVGWNAAETTWDCPCHGSRFAVTGEVLEGPATRPLEPVDVGSRDEVAAGEARRS